MDIGRKRQRVQLSVDPAVWKRCQEASKLWGYDLSWSKVAEYAFITLLDSLEQFKTEVVGGLRPDYTDQELAAAVRDFYHRHAHELTGELYAQLDEDLQSPPKPPKRGRPAG